VSLTRYSLEAAYPLELSRRKLFVRLEAECSVGVWRRLFGELQLLITVAFAASFSIVMLASGVRQKVVRAWLGGAVLGVGASVFIATTQEPRAASGYLAITGLLLTLVTTGAITHRLWQHAEISVLTGSSVNKDNLLSRA
jgi:hypothetical protein